MSFTGMQVNWDDVWYDTEPFGAMRYYKGKAYIADAPWLLPAWNTTQPRIYTIDKNNTLELIASMSDRRAEMSMGLEVFEDKIFLAIYDTNSYSLYTYIMNLDGSNIQETQHFQDSDHSDSAGVVSVLDRENGKIYYQYHRKDSVSDLVFLRILEYNISTETYTDYEIQEWPTRDWFWDSQIDFYDGYIYLVQSYYDRTWEDVDHWFLNIRGVKYKPDGSEFYHVKITDREEVDRYPSISVGEGQVFLLWRVTVNDLQAGKFGKTDLDFNNYEEIYVTNPQENDPFMQWPSLPIQIKDGILYSMACWTPYVGHEVSQIRINVNTQEFDYIVLVDSTDPNYPDTAGDSFFEDYLFAMGDEGIFYYWHGYFDAETWSTLCFATGVWKYTVKYRYMKAIRGGTVTPIS